MIFFLFLNAVIWVTIGFVAVPSNAMGSRISVIAIGLVPVAIHLFS